jgi:hypothetical protein
MGVVSLVVAAGMDGVRLGFWGNTVINITAHDKSTNTDLFNKYRLRNIHSLCLCIQIYLIMKPYLLQLP